MNQCHSKQSKKSSVWAKDHFLCHRAGCRFRADTGEPQSLQFLLQGLTVAIQRGNAVAVMGTSPPPWTMFSFDYSILGL